MGANLVKPRVTVGDNEDRDQSIDDSATVESGACGDEDAGVEVGLDEDLLCSLNEIASRLCSTCRAFPRGQIEIAGDNSDYRVYHPSLSSLQESVDAGCRICKDLFESLDTFRSLYGPSVTPTTAVGCSLVPATWHANLPRDAFCLQFRILQSFNAVTNSYESGHPLTSMTFFPADCMGLGPEFRDPSLVTSNAKSTTSMNLVRSWYSQCLAHPTCSHWRQDYRCLPTRLIGIWRPRKNSPDLMSAKLFETKDLPLSTAYTSLSHRWGDKHIFQLRQSNIKELRQSIPFSQLPQVFQDAIYVSLELGIYYIWIDSLCIIQDSKEDWTYEARRMGAVYQYAACNIAAAGYQLSSLSLFAGRKAMSQVHPLLFADCVATGTGTFDSFKGLYVRADDDEFFGATKSSILDSRAWIAQERALSPGIIHITPAMIRWECNHLIANEAFPTDGLPQGGGERYKPCAIRNLTIESDPEDIYAFWREFVCNYAGLKLTYEQDRFPAAVGIARTLSELVDDNFVAGFWEGDLIRSLVMARKGRIEDAQATQRAPSWSWASLRGSYLASTMSSRIQPLSGVSVRVLSDLPGFKSDLESTSLETSDVRGLEITAPLRKLLVKNEDSRSDSSSEWFYYMITELEIWDDDIPSGINIPEDQAWRLRDPTHMLLLAKEYQYSGDTSPIAYALLVQQVPEAEGRNTFRKLGAIEFGFRTEAKLEEYFGLHMENEEYVPSPVFGECGFQEIVLI